MKKIILTLLGSILLCICIIFAIKAEQDINILADNIYFEARNSSTDDKISVALVVINRLKSSRYPNTVSDVVFQKNQFSWTIEYSEPNRNNRDWKKCRAIAKMILDNYEHWKNPNVCLHYIANKTYPGNHWSNKFTQRTLIGKHIYLCEG